MLTYRAMEIPVIEDVVAVFDSGLEGSAPRELMNLLLNKGAIRAANALRLLAINY